MAEPKPAPVKSVPREPTQDMTEGLVAPGDSREEVCRIWRHMWDRAKSEEDAF